MYSTNARINAHNNAMSEFGENNALLLKNVTTSQSELAMGAAEA
jgi:hypothetical protein